MIPTDSYFATFPLEHTPKMDNWTKVTLKAKVNVGTAANPIEEKREAEIFLIDRDDDISIQQERLMRAILEFEDARHTSRLNLTNGPKLFASFRLLLASGLFRDTWDSLIVGVGQTVAHFNERLTEFINAFFIPEDYADQMQYMQRFRQPAHMQMTDLALRVQMINKMMQKMPGANNALPFPTDNDMKMYLYGITSMALQLKFRENHDNVLDANFTLRELMDKFRFYERVEARKHSLARRYEQRNGRNKSRVHRGQRTQAKYKKPTHKKDQPKIENPCKYHNGAHDWKYCFGNPSGPNFRPTYVLPKLHSKNDNKPTKSAVSEKDAMMFDVDAVLAEAAQLQADHEHAQKVSAKWTKTTPGEEKPVNSAWMEVEPNADSENKADA